jgi:hypothetical protein
MSDISVVTTAVQAEKRAWLLGPHGTEPGTTPSVTLDITKFSAGPHYPNGYIPSGTVISKVTATGLWGPYDSAASDGRQTVGDGTVGILFNSVPAYNAAGAARAKVGSAVFVHGFVNSSKLPFATGATGGLGSAAQTALRLIHFTAGE